MEQGDYDDWRGRDDYDEKLHKCWSCDTWFDIGYDFVWVTKLDDYVCESCAYEYELDEEGDDE
tara:strand:+ start:13058 stop:13246 length:189 start_codon:yes stop_codon:yes gene_type:complete